MPRRREIQIGNVEDGASGDFVQQNSQILFERTTNDTPVSITLEPPLDIHGSGGFLLKFDVWARRDDTTLTSLGVTLTNDLNETITTIEYTGADPVGATYIVIDTEWMELISQDTALNTFDVVRADTPTTHTAGATIYEPLPSGVTPVGAHWSKVGFFTSDSTATTISEKVGVIRDQSPATKDAEAITWQCRNQGHQIDLFGQAATTIDWVIKYEFTSLYQII